MPKTAIPQSTRYHRPVFCNDGSLAVTSDVHGFPQPFRLAGGALTPLAACEDRTIAVCDTPHGLFVRFDRGGNEHWQLGLVRGGSLDALTGDEQAVHRSAALSPDRKRIGFAYNPGGVTDFSLAVMDLATREVHPWLGEPGSWSWGAWSPNGLRATASRTISPTRNELYVLERDGRRERVLASARRAEDAAWLDDRRLIVRTDASANFMGVAMVDLGAPDAVAHWLVQGDRDVDGCILDEAGTHAVAVINDGFFDRLALIDCRTGQTLQHFTLPPGVVYGDLASESHNEQLAWAPSGMRAIVAWETFDRPASLYDLFDGTPLVESPRTVARAPQEHWFASHDGLRIPALPYRAHPEPAPTVVYIHGGPESQFRANFQPLFHALTDAGMHVLAPNVRGSTGYGIEYFSLDDKELRWDSVRDACEAGRFIRAAGVATKLAALGRSYGGFMTYAVLIEDPHLWDAGVVFVGIADWETFFTNTASWRRATRMEEYGDPFGAQKEFLRAISPLRRAHEIRAPLLICHGRNDVRVPLSEAEQMARITGAQLLILENEGHGIVRRENVELAYSRCVEFLVSSSERSRRSGLPDNPETPARVRRDSS